MPAQLANETFRADHVRFGNSVGAVVQVLMRSDVPTAEAFFRDHLDNGALLNEAAILGVAYSLRPAPDCDPISLQSRQRATRPVGIHSAIPERTRQRMPE
jgi:hypothetical protein